MKFVILMIVTLMNPAEKTALGPILIASAAFTSEKECKAKFPELVKKAKVAVADKYKGLQVATLEKCMTEDEAGATAFALTQRTTKKPDDKDKL